MNKTCGKCGSDKIVPKVQVIDRGDHSVEGNLEVAIDENPDAFFFRERFRAGISARVCGNCGFVEFYVNNPDLLYSAHQKQLAKLKSNK